jgi:hypothetical protein
MSNRRDLGTIKIPRTTAADPDGAANDSFTFDATVYDAEAIHGYEIHRQRKDALGQTWLEYVNEQATPMAPAEQLAEQLEDGLATGGVGEPIEDIARQVVDDLEGHVRQAAYQGAREAIRER